MVALGDHQKELEYAQQALAIRRELFGERHPETARSLNNVGVAWANNDDSGRAVVELLRALKIQRDLLGNGQDETVSTALSLVAVYRGSGRGLEAINILDDLLARLPRNHPRYAEVRAKREVLSVKAQRPGFRQPPKQGGSGKPQSGKSKKKKK